MVAEERRPQFGSAYGRTHSRAIRSFPPNTRRGYFSRFRPAALTKSRKLVFLTNSVRIARFGELKRE